MKKTILLALMLTGAMGMARADVLLLEEGFDDVAALRTQDWIFSNQSIPPGPITEGWFQGFAPTLTSHQGAPEAYIASSYNTAGAGGILDNWLLTPTFSFADTVTVSFFLQAEFFPRTSDQVRFGFIDGDTILDDFLLETVVTAPVGGWTRYTLTLDGQGTGASGRFGFQHFGLTDTSNYVGLDTLKITAVPEPSTAMILGLGLAGFALARRRRA